MFVQASSVSVKNVKMIEKFHQVIGVKLCFLPSSTWRVVQLHPIIQLESFKHFVTKLFTSRRAIELDTMLTLGGVSDLLCAASAAWPETGRKTLSELHGWIFICPGNPDLFCIFLFLEP